MTAEPPEDDDRTVIRPAPPPVADETKLIMAPATGAPAARDSHTGGLPVGTRLAEFEITSFVAEGGFGLVYTAHDHLLQRKVALKEYMPSSLAARGAGSQVQVKSERHRETFEVGLKSFINEARLLASFDHPALVKVYRFWEANGTAYLVMPFLEGATLKDVLRQMGRAPDEAWLRGVLTPLTEALQVIHAQQCYHRDIAPDNVMLLAGQDGQGAGPGSWASSGRWLLLDFGAARRVIGDMTQALTVILKPGYAPVEQYAEIPGMKQGAWTDVYALAAVVYFAITGKTPPPSVGRLVNDTYVPLARCAGGRYSDGFLQAIDRALAVLPETRTQSIAELRLQLGLGGPHAAPLTATPPVAAQPASPALALPADSPGPAAPAAGRRPLVWGLAGVVVLVALGYGVYRLRAPSGPAPAATAPPAAAATPGPTAAAKVPPEAAPASLSAPPPTVAAAPATPAPPAKAFEPPAEFERIVQAQTPGFAVQAAAEKTEMRAGRDELKFQLSSEREGFVYVFGYSSDGTLALLVPNGRSGTVRVKKGQTWRFPTGDGFYLPADEPLGTSHVLVMVSARQRNFDTLRPRAENLVRYFSTGEATQALAAQHSGPGSVLAGQPLCPAGTPCADEYGATVMRVQTVK